MRSEPLRRLSVWSALTGLMLVCLLAVQLAFGVPPTGTIVMLLASVVGFELFLFGRDLIHRRRRRG